MNKKSSYQIGLCSDKEDVISAHFMHQITQNPELELYTPEIFCQKAWYITQDQLSNQLLPILLHKSKRFILERATAAERRAAKFCKSNESHSPEENILAKQITEVLFDRQFLKGPKQHAAKKVLCNKIKSAITQKRPIKMVIPALPYKISFPLKARGVMPDIAEVGFLLSLGEVAQTIDILYKKQDPTLTKSMASFTVISDGTRFNRFLNEPIERINIYREELSHWIEKLNLTEYVQIIDYQYEILNRLPTPLLEEKKRINSKVHQLYQNVMLPIFDPNNVQEMLQRATEVDPDPEKSNPEGRFIPLYKSLLYTLQYKEITDYAQKQHKVLTNLYLYLTRHLFQPYITSAEFSHPYPTTTLEHLRQSMLYEAWQVSIQYIAEIRSDRDLPEDPVTVCFPEYLRWTIHAKPGQLALLTTTAQGDPVQAWHGSGVFKRTKRNKIKIYTLPVLSLEGEKAIPVLLKGGSQTQALFYIHPNVSCDNIDDFLKRLECEYTRQRKE